MPVTSLDHLVLTVRNLDATCAFYCDVLGVRRVTFGAGRMALEFGVQKINLHEAGREFEPKAALATPGSADLCFLTDEPIADVIKHWQKCGVDIIQGPVERTGAVGRLLSLYCRDPDGNLIEVAHQLPTEHS